MNIGFLVKHLGPWGGTEEYVRVVADALLARGHQVSFLHEELREARGVEWKQFLARVSSTQMPSNSSDGAPALKQYLETNRPDVLFLHSMPVTPELHAMLPPAIPALKFVHDFRPVCLRVTKVLPISRKNCDRALGYGCLAHGCSVGPSRGSSMPVSWNNFRQKAAELDVCRQMDRIFVASKFMRDLLLHNEFDRTRVVVNPLFSPSAVPEALTPLPAECRLLYVGQLQKFKGLSVLIEAMRSLPETVTLDVAGAGPWLEHCTALSTQLGLSSRVTFHGWVDRERLPHFLAHARIVVVPSIWNEPFGLVGLEAMAYGRPVVAFDVGGIREWLSPGVTGLLANELTPRALAQAIQQLHDSPAVAAQMGSAGYKAVRDRFTLQRHVDELVSEFARTVAAHQRFAS